MQDQYYLKVEWYKCTEVVPKKSIWELIKYRLHKTMQDEIDLKYDKYCLLFYESFKEYLDTI